MAERLIDRYLGFMPESSRDAFLKLAGNYRINVGENLLRVYASELDGVDPADFEIAVRRCIRDASQAHFPRWGEFAKYLPRGQGERAVSRAWYDLMGGCWGGPWPENGAGLSTESVDHLVDLRDQAAEYDQADLKRWTKAGKVPNFVATAHQNRLAFIAMLDNLIEGKASDHSRGQTKLAV